MLLSFSLLLPKSVFLYKISLFKKTTADAEYLALDESDCGKCRCEFGRPSLINNVVFFFEKLQQCCPNGIMSTYPEQY